MDAITRRPFLLIAIVCFAFFGSGVAMGKFMHLAACPLCILQRMLYLAGGIIATVALLTPGKSGRSLFSMLLSAVFITGGGVAGYQSYLQHNPLAASCSSDAAWWESFVYWAGEKIPTIFLSNGLCTDPGWKLLGLSIAEYSLIAFSGLLLISLYALLRR